MGFLLPGRAVCLHRCGAPACFVKRQSPSLCTVFSPVRVAFQYDFSSFLSFFILIFSNSSFIDLFGVVSFLPPHRKFYLADTSRGLLDTT